METMRVKEYVMDAVNDDIEAGALAWLLAGYVHWTHNRAPEAFGAWANGMALVLEKLKENDYDIDSDWQNAYNSLSSAIGAAGVEVFGNDNLQRRHAERLADMKALSCR
jgi:hypothetical protein